MILSDTLTEEPFFMLNVDIAKMNGSHAARVEKVSLNKVCAM